MRLQVSVETLRIVSLGSRQTEGAIWLEHQDGAFPSRGWIDYPVTVVRGWCQVLSDAPSSTELYFADGPHSLRIRKVGGEGRFACYTNETVQWEGSADYLEFRASVWREGAKILLWAESRAESVDWMRRDLSALRSLVGET